MNKKIVVAAIAAAIATPLVASADATLYGQVRVASQYHSRSDGAQDSWGLQDQVSRLGVKGDEDLGNGLKAIYKMEFGVNVGNGFNDKSSFWSQRNSYVGLAGGFGTVLAGRHDTPFKISTGKLDFFGDTNADFDSGFGYAAASDNAGGVGLFDSLRVDGAIAYVSPSIAGFTVAGAVVQTGTTPANDQADDFASAYSLAGMYSNGPWFASLAYESLDMESLGIAGANTPDYDKWRVGLGILGFNNFSASFTYEDRTDLPGSTEANGIDSNSWQLQAAYDFGNTRVMGMYGQLEFDNDILNDTNGFDTWAIGLQHNLSKRTDVQVIYRQKDVKDINGVQGAPDDDVFAIQLDHSF
jgi:predicted porin